MNQELLPNTDKWQRMSALITNSHTTVSYSKLWLTRTISENILVFLLQYSGLMFSTLTAYPSPIWFASGTSCAFIFLRGTTVLPGIWLGTLVAYFLMKFTFLESCSFATLFSLQAYLLLKLCYQYTGPSLIFYQKRLLATFAAMTSIITALLSLVLVYIFFFSKNVLIIPSKIWLQWWLANLNGIVIVGCAIYTWDTYFPQIGSLSKNILFKITLLFCALLTCFISLIYSHQLILILALMFCNLLLLAFIGYYYGWCGIVAAEFISAVFISVLLSINITHVNIFILPFLFTIQVLFGFYLGTSHLQKEK